jgi:hypothetical protein
MPVSQNEVPDSKSKLCDRCGTAWEYENYKSNLHAGWSVVRR